MGVVDEDQKMAYPRPPIPWEGWPIPWEGWRGLGRLIGSNQEGGRPSLNSSPASPSLVQPSPLLSLHTLGLRAHGDNST